MNLQDIAPVIPLLVVALAGCAVLIAEAFRKAGERTPFSFGWFGAIGFVGAIVQAIRLWDRNAVGMKVVVMDNYARIISPRPSCLRDRTAHDSALGGRRRS